MESGAVVEGLDVIEDGGASLGAGEEAVMIDEFVFETAPEGLDEGVIVAVALATHGSEQAVLGQHLPDAVKIYTVAPANAETIGMVTSYVNAMGQIGGDIAIGTLKSAASKIGANGIILTASHAGYWSGTQISGQAIFVP